MFQKVVVVIAMLLVIHVASAVESIKIDGSSTVYPISAAMSQYAAESHPGLEADVRFSGTSSGFRKLLAGEIPISGASRPIKSAELEKAAARGIEIIELPVAYDGITVVVNRNNSFIKDVTVEELKKLWEPNSSIKRWSQLRADWPDKPVVLYEPGKDSGTFEYFTKAIVGKAHASRTDVVTSEDDAELVEGVVVNETSMAYFGWAYFLENKDVLKAISIAPTAGKAVAPSKNTILDGSYSPLSRPIFIYVNKAELNRPEVKKFCEFYIRSARNVVGQVGYVPLSDDVYDLVMQRLQNRTTGSLFSGKKSVDVKATLMAAKQKPVASKASGGQSISLSQPTQIQGMSSEEFELAVNDLRDACLQLSQQALSDRTQIGELQKLVNELAQRVSSLNQQCGENCSLAGK